MDIGQACEDTYFINIAAAGSFTELTYSVPSQLKTMFGYLAYLAKGLNSYLVFVRFQFELNMKKVSLKVTCQ